MKQTVLFVVLNEYADWERAFLSTALHDCIWDKKSKYEVKTISLEDKPIKSIGGFTTVPDCSIDTTPIDFNGIILIGGKSWRTPEAQQIAPLIKEALEQGKVVGAICDATVFLGMNGMLNDKKHTSNTLDELKKSSGENYTGSNNYVPEQAVRDGNLITANGSAYLEFTSEVLTALNAYPKEYIDNNNAFYRDGYIKMQQTLNQ